MVCVIRVNRGSMSATAMPAFSEMHGRQTGRSRSSRTRTVIFSGAMHGSSSTLNVLFVTATVHRRLVDANDLVRARDDRVAEITSFFGQRVSTLNRHSAMSTRRSLDTAWANVARLARTRQVGKSR